MALNYDSLTHAHRARIDLAVVRVVKAVRKDHGRMRDVNRGLVARVAQVCRDMSIGEAALVEGIAAGILDGSVSE